MGSFWKFALKVWWRHSSSLARAGSSCQLYSVFFRFRRIQQHARKLTTFLNLRRNNIFRQVSPEILVSLQSWQNCGFESAQFSADKRFYQTTFVVEIESICWRCTTSSNRGEIQPQRPLWRPHCTVVFSRKSTVTVLVDK